MKRIVQKTNEFLRSTGATISYGVLFDADKHKSRRWVYELARQQGLSYQPQQVGYATESAITRMAENDIETIFTFDDATYSGAQNYDLKREVERVYKKLGKKLPKIIIATPFVTRKVIEQAVGEEYLYDQIMPTMDELFSEEVKEYPKDARFTGDYLEYGNTRITLTYFSFKVADSTSFVRRIGYLINQVIAPYAQKGTPFYAIEERDFHSGEISAVDFNQVDPKAQLMPKPIIEPKFESLDEMKQRLVEALKAQEHAMNQIKELSEQGEEKGGIDLTADRMNLDVESDKAQINQPLDLKELENIEINALYIKNIEIKPLNNLPELLGVSS